MLIMSKFIRYFSLITLIFLVFNACNKQKQENNSSAASEKIQGTWLSSHEPFGYFFKPDGTYELFATDPRNVQEKGIWAVEGNYLVTTSSEQQKQSRKINFVEGVLFLGDIPEFDPKCTECEYKTASEYVKEMGLRKQ